MNNPLTMNREIAGTDQKALQINLDPGKYGTFAEIGAGQEVARWFFRVGGAAGTIAKTISAYDMMVSDAIYGPCERYVSRQRLQSMLDHEYALLLERLDAKRGDTTRFFVFANTVAARSFTRHDEPHGWMGVRFQTEPRSEASEIIIHVRMLDKENLQEQEALGIIGVNLIYAACGYSSEQEPQAQGEEIVVLMEMTLRNLTGDGGVIDHKDFLDRVDLLGSLGKTVLISNYARYFRLASYLSQYTKKMIGVVMGVPSLREVFEEKYYTDLEGGILEAFGRLFKNDLRLYVYPFQDPTTGSIITAGNLRVAPHLRHLYSYLLENQFIQSIQDYNDA